MKQYLLNDRTGRRLLDFTDCYLPQQNYHPVWHTHHALEISCVKSGSGIYYIDEKTYEMNEGDVFIISNTEKHCIGSIHSPLMINTVIHFEPEFIWNMTSSDVDYQFFQIFFEKDKEFSNRLDKKDSLSEKIYSLMLEIEKEFAEALPAHKLMIKTKLQTIIAEIIRSYNFTPAESISPVMPMQDIDQINKVLRYIDEHLGEDICLNDFAQLVSMSPSYFSSFFKKYNGLTPFEYLVSKRVQRAVEYILSTRKTLIEIATLCGFNNSTNFNKAFKRVTGNSPSYYRQTYVTK